ncbi:MAG: type II toxin-antitoxin system VapB family antitoxin [Deltaproteobacteria bacterium]|nr:type II toxin-antitoxin system VapB family antitoxin [Deltaproteobacteria bacterium]MBI4373729.1 type II toxin-antitoxin system VapB family antitoxin [Deltaproteobacteria bacterium]
MRTTVTLDSGILQTLQEISGARSKAKAVLSAIQEYIRRHRVSRIKELKGKIHFALSADEIRHAQR